MERYNNRCNKCGRFIKRGIINMIKHSDECGLITSYKASFPILKKPFQGHIFYMGSKLADEFKQIWMNGK